MARVSHAIAQVSPHPWEAEHDLNAFVAETSRELARRGHRVAVLAPTRDTDLVRASRRRIRSGDLFAADGDVQVLGVGELLPVATGRRGGAPSPPVDIARTIEEAMGHAAFDLVHVHEPFAPSASSVALRHSRALNVGSFHVPTERPFSTQVARRFVELFFGRLDARTTSYAATREALRAVFPAPYRVITPGVTPLERPARDGGAPVRIAFLDREERGALRLFLRALRRLPLDAAWEATVFVPGGAAPTGPLGARVRERLTVLSAQDATEAEVLAGADIVVAASGGQAPSPGLLLRAVGAGATPVASRLAAYAEIVEEHELGRLFEAGDVDTLAAQLERLTRDPALREQLRERGRAAAAGPLSWTRVTDELEAVYEELAARRHAVSGNAAVGARLASRPQIDVDLHMHTDHSSDCATPVEVLLATARDQGLGAIAVTDHNEISGALDAREKAAAFGVKVIVGEEVKTADQGEVIGLFLEEKIPRGLTLDETIADIRRQGGLVYVPHPFDRLHTVPDYEHMLAIVEDIDAIEVFNPRVAIPAFNEEAARFAAKYRIIAGAGSDAHVARGLGSVRIRMRDFDGPEEFLESLRDADILGRPSSLTYVQVQALKFLQTRATPREARQAVRRRKVAKALAGRRKA